MNVTIAEAIGIALQHHLSGRLAEAEGIYRQILAHEPDHADSLHLLGVIAHQSGRSDHAVEWIGRAIALSPAEPAYHSNLGEAHRNLGRMDEAIADFRRALALKPDFAEAHANLGGALIASGRPDEAVAALHRAIQLCPELADAHNNLGVALGKLGRPDEAIRSFHEALRLRKDDIGARNNLGEALWTIGRVDEAIAILRGVVQEKPDCAEAWNNLGNALKYRCQLDESVAAYRAALRIAPGFSEAWNNLASVLKDVGRIDEAVAAYRRSLAGQPGSCPIHSNLLVTLHYVPDCDPGTIFGEHRRWDELHARKLESSCEPHANDPAPARRLRIGLVSADFRDHPVAFFLGGFLADHDRSQVEIFCYSDLLRPDEMTAQLRRDCAQWRDISGVSDSQVAGLVRDDAIDILVDLAGHTARNRLLVFARRPAPVQVTWLGYCDTTGLKAVQYRLTDVHADPPGTTEHLHTETLIRLPGTFACFRPAEDSPPVEKLPALTRGHVMFGSFHTQAKLNDTVLEHWSAILSQVPGSRLLLMAAGLDDAAFQQRYIGFFAKRGIAASRLEFRGRQPLAGYLALHGGVDVLLDTHPFTGHTVSCHALWMGVPVVTLAGGTHCSRMVTSVLMNLGRPEWIAHTPEDYVRIACDLAADLPRLAALRAGLRGQMSASPLTDAPRFSRHLEHAFRGMWRAWCEGAARQPGTR